MLRTFLSIIKYTLNKNDSGEIAAVKKASDHSDVDVCMTSAIFIFIYLLVYLIGTMHIHEHCCIKIHHVNMPELVTITTFHPQSLGR